MRVYFYYSTHSVKSQAKAESDTIGTMKVLQMNVWTGRMKGAIERFLREHDFDIICLQEAVWCDEQPAELEYFCSSVRQIQEACGLPYCTKVSNWGVKMFNGGTVMDQGNVILSRFPIVKDETKLLHGDYLDSMIFEQGDDHAYFAQKVHLNNGLTVVNYHGYWLPNPIGDEETVRCMQQVADWIKEESGPVVMCGDLNVTAESPAMRTLDFMTDLTATNKVRTTLQNIKFIKDVACDHILINDQIRANNLVVYDNLVSDHKTLSLDFDIISHDA